MADAENPVRFMTVTGNLLTFMAVTGSPVSFLPEAKSRSGTCRTCVLTCTSLRICYISFEMASCQPATFFSRVAASIFGS